jgi:hypothetical protein
MIDQPNSEEKRELSDELAKKGIKAPKAKKTSKGSKAINQVSNNVSLKGSGGNSYTGIFGY